LNSVIAKINAQAIAHMQELTENAQEIFVGLNLVLNSPAIRGRLDWIGGSWALLRSGQI
jgi:hypothetical protein